MGRGGGVRQVQSVSSKCSFITLNPFVGGGGGDIVRLASDEFVKFSSVQKLKFSFCGSYDW